MGFVNLFAKKVSVERNTLTTAFTLPPRAARPDTEMNVLRTHEWETIGTRLLAIEDTLACAEDVMLSSENTWARILDVLRVSKTENFPTSGNRYDVSLDDVINHFKAQTRKTVSCFLSTLVFLLTSICAHSLATRGCYKIGRCGTPQELSFTNSHP